MATLVSDHVQRRREACIAAVETFHPVPANDKRGPKSRFVKRAASLISGAGLAQREKDPSHGGYFGAMSSTARSWFLSSDWKLLATMGAQRVIPPALTNIAAKIGIPSDLKGERRRGCRDHFPELIRGGLRERATKLGGVT